MTEYTVNDSDFKLLGRTAAVDGSAVLSWTNSGFDFKYRGGGFVLFFEEYALQSPVYLKLIVDGKEQKAVASTGKEAVVYEDIREGVHIARVIRITEGEVPLRVCRVRITGKKAQLLKEGDVVNIPVGVRHWHGATATSWFSHLAIEVPGKNASNVWHEPVSDEDYEKANERR